MADNSTFNILMYSHDTYGLGHIRRTMAIASHLREKKVNILVITGSPIVGRFEFPEQIDFVRIPGMIKKTNEEYHPLSIKINAGQALEIRKSIISATAKTFQPHLFIVDKEPLGLKKEVLPTLEWMKRSLPETRTILGLRDIMDDAETVRQDWKKKGIYQILDSLYNEIWVYGIQDFYDPIQEYAISEKTSGKIQFTGYIPRKVVKPSTIKKIKRDHKIDIEDKLVVVTTGGGGDGFPVMDTYLSMLETTKMPYALKSILVTGPFMPGDQRKEISKRARALGIITYKFFRRMEDLMASADLVVSMGGYNTTCEILAQETVSLLVPRESPRKEQLIRAQVFEKQHLVDYIPWKALTAQAIKEKVLYLLEKPKKFQQAMSEFKMTAYDIIRKRLAVFREGT